MNTSSKIQLWMYIFVIHTHHGKEVQMKTLMGYLDNFSLKAVITDKSLKEVVDVINNRPRKRLGYKTPLEVLSKFFE